MSLRIELKTQVVNIPNDNKILAGILASVHP
jgi:hypothetical protein